MLAATFFGSTAPVCSFVAISGDHVPVRSYCRRQTAARSERNAEKLNNQKDLTKLPRLYSAPGRPRFVSNARNKNSELMRNDRQNRSIRVNSPCSVSQSWKTLFFYYSSGVKAVLTITPYAVNTYVLPCLNNFARVETTWRPLHPPTHTPFG